MAEQRLEWTVARETCAELMLQGAHPWQIVNSMVEADMLNDVQALIDEVRTLWGQEATHGADPALDETLAQLRRVRRLAWDKWQGDKNVRWLKLVRDTEIEIGDVRGQVRDVLDDARRSVDVLRLPPWVPTYLAAWASKRPYSKRVTVTWAARMAGTTASNVRDLRRGAPRFRVMEQMARFGEGKHIASMISGGLRGNASLIFEAFMTLVASGNSQAVLKAMEWLQNKPTALFKIAAMTNDELLAYYDGLLAHPTPSGDGATGEGSTDVAPDTG